MDSFDCISCGKKLNYRARPNRKFICNHCDEFLEHDGIKIIKQQQASTIPRQVRSWQEEFKTHTTSIFQYSTFFLIKYDLKKAFFYDILPISKSLLLEDDPLILSQITTVMFLRNIKGIFKFKDAKSFYRKFKLLNTECFDNDSNDWFKSIIIETGDLNYTQDFEMVKEYILSTGEYFVTQADYRVSNIIKDSIIYNYIGGNTHWYALCSDNECDCPGMMLMRNQGYIYSEQIRIGEQKAIRSILICEDAARQRNLDLIYANNDAKLWWKTGWVTNVVTISNFNIQKAPIRQSHDKQSQILLNQQLKQEKSKMLHALLKPQIIFNTYVFVDIETNGLPIIRNEKIEISNNWPFIVQIAWRVYLEDGSLLSSNSYFIKVSNYKIDAESYRIHGITEAMADRQGISCKDALEEFNSVLKNATLLVGHNIEFDSNIIQAEMHRNKVSNSIKDIKHFCTMLNSKEYCDIRLAFGLKNPDLKELYRKIFNKSFSGEHNAKSDILATAECFWKLKELNIIA